MAAQELEGLAWRTRLLTAGVGLSAFTSGTLAALSLITVPALLAAHTSTSSLLTTWRHILDRGVKTCPPLAVAATLVHLSNAYAYSATTSSLTSSGSGGNARTYSLLAAASTIAIVPFTVVVMAGTNGELFRREKATASAAGGGGGGVDAGSSRELVRKWGRLNAVRALLPAVGAVVACLAL